MWRHFSQIHAYFENYLLLELKRHSLDIHSASSSCLEDQKLWKSFCYIIPGGWDRAVHLNPLLGASSHCNFHIQFPMYTKNLRNVEGDALNISVHRNYVISRVPPTGHRKSDRHHLIDMKFTACFFPIMTCK